MCESRAYLFRDGMEELLLEDVELIRVEGGRAVVKNILGEEKVVNACVREINFTDHKVVLEASGD